MTDTWGPWTQYRHGVEPVPDVAAGQFLMEFSSGKTLAPDTLPSYALSWQGVHRYRLRIPSIDWEALAREAVNILAAMTATNENWCSQIDKDTSWDSWDHCFKDMKYGGIPTAQAFLDRARKAGVS